MPYDITRNVVNLIFCTDKSPRFESSIELTILKTYILKQNGIDYNIDSSKWNTYLISFNSSTDRNIKSPAQVVFNYYVRFHSFRCKLVCLLNSHSFTFHKFIQKTSVNRIVAESSEIYCPLSNA